MSILTLAQEHQRKRNELSERVARSTARLWRSIQAGNIDAGWDRIAPELERTVVAGQYAAAASAQRYTAAVSKEYGVTGTSGAVVASAFTGATLEGREVVPELFTAATTTKRLIGSGVGVGAAFQSGTALMSLLTATMVRDSGNMADKVSSVKRGYVQMSRVLSPGACSRCAILAGPGNFSKHFERHPQCRCTTIPVLSGEPSPDGIYDSAGAYFNSLSEAEQNRVFTKSGAEAIRLGANENAVVNARRGMYRTTQPGSLVSRATPRTIIGPDGKPFTAYTTTEGTSVRGWFGGGRGGSVTSNRYVRNQGDRYRRTTSIRLMPETIMQIATSPEDATRLLREFGYLY